METLSEAHDDSSGANPSSIKSDDGSPPPDGDCGSPPPNCAICLGRCRNKSFTDSCLHQFCFKCLLTWSKVKTECPLCKQNFKSIIHNVQSNQQYEEYRVEERRYEDDRIEIDDLVTATRRFRYRTTLTIPRGGEHMALQRLLMHYPPLSAMVDMSRPLTGITPAALPSSRRRRSPSSFRRTVYRHNLWARPLPDFTGRHRDCTPEFYRYNESQMTRLIPWLNRELHYLLLENTGHIAYVLSRILDLLPQYHITSPEFRTELYRYFGSRTDHFLHELQCFASTPYDLTGYDRNVQYTTDSRISSTINDIVSSSDTESGDSDIVLVTTEDPTSLAYLPHRPASPPPHVPHDAAGPSARRLPDPVYPLSHIALPIEAARLSRSVVPIETISHSDTDDDEVMVTGYIKPPSQRTPEVVDLRDSDDSDVVVTEGPAPASARDPRGYVKLTWSRPRPAPEDSEDGDSTYTPTRRAPSSTSYSPCSSLTASPCSASLHTPSTPRGDDEGDIERLTRDMERMPNSEAEARSEPTAAGGRGRRRKRTRRSRDAEEPAVSVSAGPSAAYDSEEHCERNRRKKSKSSNGKGVKSSSRRDIATNVDPSRTEPTSVHEESVSMIPLPVVREEPRPGPSKPGIKPSKSSRREMTADSRETESPEGEQADPQPGPSSRPAGGKGGRSRRVDTIEYQRLESTTEPRPGPSSRAEPGDASSTLKRRTIEEISSRRNTRESKRLRSVVKKTSNWSSSAPASSSAARAATSARISASGAPSCSAVSSLSKRRRRSSSSDDAPARHSPDFFTDSDDDIPLNLTIQRSGGQS